MKLLFVLAAFVGSAFSQAAFIEAPLPGASVAAGSNVTIEVSRPDSMEASTEVAIVLSLQSCAGFAPAGTCDGVDFSDDLGTTLYLGPFAPEFHGPGLPYQNFTVAIPSFVPKGAAALTLSHWSLAGLGPSEFFEVKNITVNVV